MKKIWNFINEFCGTILAWLDSKAHAFWFALVLTVLGFFGADPVEGIALLNVCFFAFLVGVLTTGVLLFGTSIVKKSEYNFPALVYGCFGSFFGVLAAILLDRLFT